MAKKKFTSDAAMVFLQSHDVPEKMKEDMQKEGISIPDEYVNNGQKSAVKSPSNKDKVAAAPQSRLSIYVPKSYHQQLKKEAVLNDMTLSDYVISLIDKARR